jgi:ABC-type multidrug transport system fused ATPase/permease subunit
MTIVDIVRKFKFSIALVLSFVVLENISWIIEPTFFGTLLDALIERFYDKEKVNYLLPLFIWAGIYLLNVAGGTLHRYFSGKVYAKVYADTATNVITYSRKKGFPTSTVFARADLAKEYIVFLKERLPEVLWQISATFGAIIALFFYDWRIAALAVIVIIPIAHINNIYRKHVVRIQRSLHDKREDQYGIIETGDPATIREYFYNMVAPQSKIAKWSSIDFMIIKVLLMFIFIGVLFIAVDVDQFSTGKIYAIVSYIWTFIASTDYIPGLMESITAVRELNSRLKEEKI